MWKTTNSGYGAFYTKKDSEIEQTSKQLEVFALKVEISQNIGKMTKIKLDFSNNPAKKFSHPWNNPNDKKNYDTLFNTVTNMLDNKNKNAYKPLKNGFSFHTSDLGPVYGTSGGTTVATLLMSFFSKCPIKEDIITTGEVVGEQIKKVASLKQKLSAVDKYNKLNNTDIKVAIPTDNLQDYYECAKQLPKCKVIPVKNLRELFRLHKFVY